MNVQQIKNLVDQNKIEEAQIALKKLLFEIFPYLHIEKVEIKQSQLSLNSVNGFITLHGAKELFFKFHTEENEILEEYYSSELLAKYHLPIVKPLYISRVPGKQILIYEKINNPTCFALLDGYERGEIGEIFEEKFLNAQKKLDKKLYNVAINTLQIVDNLVYDESRLLQLFYRRLKVKNGTARVDEFYQNKDINLPDGTLINFEELKKYKWVINDRKYESSLEDLILSATEVLDPFKYDKVPVCVGHGDDHYGNIFAFEENGKYEFKLFDPAFAEDIQHVLLTQVKATFHNIFAHPFWLYNPERLEKDLKIEFDLDEENKILKINHNWDLKENSIRTKLLNVKIENFWKPLITELEKRNPPYPPLSRGQDCLIFIKRALFCCPFLCLNLINLDKEKSAVFYTPKTSLLALSKAVEMGHFSFLL